MVAPAPKPEFLTLTTRIVAAYVARNAVMAADVPALIERTYKALASLPGLGEADALAAASPVPAVPVKKSVFSDFIVCLEDGRKMKMLKRHLATAYGMTPEQYRTKWRLPAEYPMVAPSYAEQRSALAKTTGLGRKPAAAPEPIPVQPGGKRRGRPPSRAAA